ncbi:MAG: S-layer homology domain-containing protein [Clostridia bacterium]|nr:S-layer homology domain-containing protein [Clostridia bacterium]
MKKRLLSLCLAVLLCVVSLSAFAETIPVTPSFENVVVDYDRVNGTVAISGEAPFAINLSEPVRLMLLKPDTGVGDTNLQKLISGTATFATVGVHVDETTLSGDKSFTFVSFTLPGGAVAGDYTLRLSSENITYTDMIHIASVSETVTAMNQIADGSTILSNIEKYNDVYQLSVGADSAYGQLSAEGKTQVINGLCNKTYANATEIKNTFDALVQLSRVTAGPWGVIEDVVTNYSVILELTPYMSSFNALNSLQKDQVYKTLVGKNYQSSSAFALAFNDAVTLAINTPLYPNNSYGSNSSVGSVSSAIKIPEDAGKAESNQPVAQNKTFSDLEQYSWAEESILKLYQKGIINGKADNIFAPADFVTRSEAIKMIVLAFGQVELSAECGFQDVPKESWMYPYIATALSQRIVNGYDDNRVGANDTITREDFATMILRAVQAADKTLAVTETVNNFNDSDSISAYAQEAVQTLQQAGVINGADNNCYLPKNSTTRAEAAKIIAALLD